LFEEGSKGKERKNVNKEWKTSQRRKNTNKQLGTSGNPRCRGPNHANPREKT
jgi:hypothetical protein